MTSKLASTTLRIGDLAPLVSLAGLDGETVRLADILAERSVLLLFAPGAWSPATRRQVGEINAIYEQFLAIDVEVVVLITQSGKSLQGRLGSYAIPFPILADEAREAARDYGVYQALSWHGIGVTRPAAFIVDKSGVIRFIYVGADDGDTPETDSLFRLCSWLVGVAAPVVTAEEANPEPGEATAVGLVAVGPEDGLPEEGLDGSGGEEPAVLVDAPPVGAQEASVEARTENGAVDAAFLVDEADADTDGSQNGGFEIPALASALEVDPLDGAAQPEGATVDGVGVAASTAERKGPGDTGD